ncbi:PTS sugar transporter subunit IIB [Candidatus Epulonipiscium viviparus]|uniref:PTS sugar transporter subunit IIB n=1 Tax=Candidatus Epulonipiscium viviparus TaxID=420336 RepID=UPI00016C0D8B|nr:PTS sugar transporter subunit IIB [Candidatus Epulopiscium viviparus]
MLNILCVCGNGMGTSTLLKINVKKICTQHGIDANVDSCAFGEAMMFIANTDIVLTSPEWSSMLPPNKAVIAETKNLVDIKGVTAVLLDVVKNNFPAEMK